MNTIIDLDFDEKDMESGVFAISIVEDPAIEVDFITLSSEKEEMHLAAIDDKKRLLMGAVLIPDIVIPRANGKAIRFSKEVIRKASEVFFKRGYQQSTNIEHTQEQLEGMTVVESWIVEDEKSDKSALYGIEAPVGSWVVSMKCDNDEVYEMAKKGIVKGFSIEGIFPSRTESSIEDMLSKYNDEDLEALSALCDLATQLADSKDEAKQFIKDLMLSRA